jgi:hypothetical protein
MPALTEKEKPQRELRAARWGSLLRCPIRLNQTARPTVRPFAHHVDGRLWVHFGGLPEIFCFLTDAGEEGTPLCAAGQRIDRNLVIMASARRTLRSLVRNSVSHRVRQG